MVTGLRYCQGKSFCHEGGICAVKNVFQEFMEITDAALACDLWIESWFTPEELPINHARLRDDAPDEIKERFKRVFGDEKGYLEKIDLL